MALKTLLNRIESKQMRLGPRQCWPWLGYIHLDGEGRIWVDDEIGSISVARAWYLANDVEIPPDKEAVRCPILDDCSNPDHFSLVSREELADRILWKKGLKRRPARAGRPRRDLSEEQIRQIFLSDGTVEALAEKYQTTGGQIANIKAGRKHRRITEPLRVAKEDQRRHVSKPQSDPDSEPVGSAR